MAGQRRTEHGQTLAQQARLHLVEGAAQQLDSLLDLVQERLSRLLDEAVSSRDMQQRRDAWMLFQSSKLAWRDATVAAWQAALQPVAHAAPATASGELELLNTDVVEDKIVASRLALNLMEKSAQEVNDLRKRLKFLNHDGELQAQDLAHPQVLLLPLVENWRTSGQSPETWLLISEVVQQHLGAQLAPVYARCNAELIAQGVLPVIELGAAVVPVTPMAMGSSGGYAGAANLQPGAASAGMAPGTGAGYAAYGRAQGLLEQVVRLLAGSSSAALPAQSLPQTAQASRPSAPLVQAMAQQSVLQDACFDPQAVLTQAVTPVVLQRLAGALRDRSLELRGQAQSEHERTTIELVTLMFQAILQEDRIASGIRVWFARLQMPVLRVALAEPDFFSKMDHPARQLIDHMGSCVMGFDASGVHSAALEAEIKRIVQVIEQYPDTGEMVYRKTYEEFLTFLKQHLTDQPATQKLLGVAEQLELKETLAIQYTIELRNQIKDMPVRQDVREFLYKVWAEVLAVAAVRHGPRGESTLLYKKTASDLVWAASAKPDRAERAQVIANLPQLIQRLRSGMALLGMAEAVQQAHVKVISETLADAFMSKTQAIDNARIEALAARLENLEDYIGEGGMQELPLDAQSIEELLGIDASQLDVLTEGGGTASAEQLAAAGELVLGSWFRLDYQAQLAQVQYVWRSPMGYLHLFGSALGRSYLIQTVRLAAYLQSGLLQAQEDEPLILRATRDAVNRLQAEPSRLMY